MGAGFEGAPLQQAPGESPGTQAPSLVQTLRSLQQVQQESARLASASGAGGDNAKFKGKDDPSLQSATPDVVYVNGVPTYKGVMLKHPLGYSNAKVGGK